MHYCGNAAFAATFSTTSGVLFMCTDSVYCWDKPFSLHGSWCFRQQFWWRFFCDSVVGSSLLCYHWKNTTANHSLTFPVDSVTTDGTTFYFEYYCDFILGLQGNSITFSDLIYVSVALTIAADVISITIARTAVTTTTSVMLISQILSADLHFCLHFTLWVRR